MEKKKNSLLREFTKGIVKENPVLRLVLGCCATLAVTTAASNAIGMGAATTFVLVCSNAVISLLRKVIPDKVRIPAFITIVAGFVTIVQLFNLINERQTAGRGTVLSTNLTVKELQGRYTERIVSRLMDPRQCTLLQFMGSDIRRRKA